MSGRIIHHQKTSPVNFASFEQAQRYVMKTGPDWTLENLGCGIYVVARANRVVGKGMHYNTAIADAESNIDYPLNNFSLDLHGNTL